MWHHERSTNGVASTASACRVDSDSGRAVISPVAEPAARAACSACTVAHVPPSCETPMTAPPRCGSQ